MLMLGGGEFVEKYNHHNNHQYLIVLVFCDNKVEDENALTII